MKSPTDRGNPTRFPRSVTVTIGVLALAAVVTAIASHTVVAAPARSPWSLAPVFFALLVAAASMIMRFQVQRQVMALELFEAMLAPVIVTYPGLVVAAMVAASQTIANSIRGNHPVKALFNVAQWTLAAGVASLVYGSLRDGPAANRSLGAIVIAMTAAAAVNVVAFATVIRQTEGQPIRAIAPTLAPSLLVAWVVNVAFGVLFVAASREEILVTALFIVPLLVLRWAHRSYAAVIADRARLRKLQEATRALATPIDPREALAEFLQLARACFDAAAVELVQLLPGGRMVHRLEQGTDAPVMRIETDEVEGFTSDIASIREPVHVRSRDGERMSMLLARAGWEICRAAPLIADGRPLGALCVYDPSGPEGASEGDSSVLVALASEAAVALTKGRLLEQMMEERSKLAEIVERASDGIFTLAPDGTVLMWNPALEAVSGYAAGEMIGSRLIDVLRAQDDDGRDVSLERWAEHRGPLPGALRIRTRDGGARWLACSYTQVADDEGRSRRLIVVARDITKVHEVERMKDDFVATVSHELRTPLTPIRGWAETLIRFGERLEPGERAEAARSILAQTEHLERLITSLLLVATVEREKDTPRDAVVDVAAIAGKVVQGFRNTSPGRVIRVSIPERPCRARGDEVFIEQIVANLLSNALKYAPPAEPIDVVIADEGRGAEVAVIDRGPGIPPAEIERIFDRFYRLGNVLTRPSGGTGLGLYIARQMAAAMGATLTVRSGNGDGSTFTLHLRPARRLAAAG